MTSSPVTVLAVGDLQLGDSPTTVGYGFYSRYRARPIANLLGVVRDSSKGTDVVFGNLETSLEAPRPGEASREGLQLRGDAAFARDLRAVGFTVMNVANNHATQHGVQAFHATVAALASAGIACCGIRGSNGWASDPAMVLGGRVGVLGYCLRPRQYSPDVPPYAEGDRESIVTDVTRLAATGCSVLVSLHWGEEFVPAPSEDEVALAHAIIDAGARMILGHHPHVTRPVEQYRRGIVAYSLGNFIGDMVWYRPFRTGAIVRCTIDGASVKSAAISATHLQDDYRPVLTAEPAVPPMPSSELPVLTATEYANAIRRTWRRQRLASYRFALANAWRTPPRILLQLVADTLRNKLAPSRAQKPGAAPD